MTIPATSSGCFKTRLALFWMQLAAEPLTALYVLLPFILKKDLGATTLQISLFLSLRPVLPIFSFYWNSFLTRYKKRLLFKLVGAWIIARVPFFFVPLFNHVWFLIFACGIYQLFSQAGTPALIEILKRNIPKEPREKVFSWAYALSFIESALLGMTFGYLLDINPNHWKLFLILSALVGLSTLFIQLRLKVQETLCLKSPSENVFLAPWKKTIELLRKRPDFAKFQWSFMLGGFALMFMAPALNSFYTETLCLSHGSMTAARFVFMAMGIIGSSFLWRSRLDQNKIFPLLTLILMGFLFFPIFVLFAKFLHPVFLYLAFLIYGIAQAGSHLIWNLSGTLFAGEEDSSLFTATNILMIGVRGIIASLLGGLFTDLLGSVPVILAGCLITFYGVLQTKKFQYTSRDLNIG